MRGGGKLSEICLYPRFELGRVLSRKQKIPMNRNSWGLLIINSSGLLIAYLIISIQPTITHNKQIAIIAIRDGIL